MDCSKVIAAGALYDGDPWDMIFHGQENVYIPKKHYLLLQYLH